jgi:hypothetical protein
MRDELHYSSKQNRAYGQVHRSLLRKYRLVCLPSLGGAQCADHLLPLACRRSDRHSYIATLNRFLAVFEFVAEHVRVAAVEFRQRRHSDGQAEGNSETRLVLRDSAVLARVLPGTGSDTG